MVRFFIGVNKDGSLRVKARAESEEGDAGNFRCEIPVGTDAFGMTFANLKHYAETQHYFDYEDESHQVAA